MDTPPALTEPPASAPAPRVLPLQDLLGVFDADALARFEAKRDGRALGPVTGLPGLDAALGAALTPGLHTLHGGSGVGKTAFALQIAAMCGCPALYVSCEMSALELLRRITARVTGTYLGRFRTGELYPDEARRLVRKAVKSAPAMAIVDATTVPLPATSGDLASPGLLQLAAALDVLPGGDAPHRLIVVDSLHSWAEGACPDMPEYEAINTALAGLRGVAQRLACPILMIAERNRSSTEKGGISAGAGSRKIEYGGESVIGLDRKKDMPKDANGETLITLKIEKNRNGEAGKEISLSFHGATQRFREE